MTADRFVSGLRALRVEPGHRVFVGDAWLTVARTTDTRTVTGTPRIRILWEESGALPLTVHAAEILTVATGGVVDLREPLRDHRPELTEIPEGSRLLSA